MGSSSGPSAFVVKTSKSVQMINGAESCLWWFWKVSLFLPSSGISTSQRSGRSRGTRPCGTPAGLLCSSHEDIAHRNACLPVLALIIQKAVEVLYPGVLEFAGILNQQQVDAGHVGRLFAEVMDFFPAKDVDGQVILFLNFGDL